MATVANGVQELARHALELQAEILRLQSQLNEDKDGLRAAANGNKLELTIEGVGEVRVSKPREGSEKIVLTLDEDRLNQVPELRGKLLETGVAKEEVKKTPAAKASVTIKPNV